MTFRTSEMTQVFLIAVACSGAESGTAAIGPGTDSLLLLLLAKIFISCRSAHDPISAITPKRILGSPLRQLSWDRNHPRNDGNQVGSYPVLRVGCAWTPSSTRQDDCASGSGICQARASSSTFRRLSGNRDYSIATRRVISGEELN
jgi:hypothetical protein